MSATFFYSAFNDEEGYICQTYRHEGSPDNIGTSEILPHYHEAVELVCVFEGTGTFFIDHTPYTVEKGDVLFINSEVVHSFQAQQYIRYSSILMNLNTFKDSLFLQTDEANLLLQFTQHSLEVSMKAPAWPACSRRLYRLTQNFLSVFPDDGSSVYHFHEHAYILNVLACLADADVLGPSKIPGSQSPIKASLRYIMENYDRKITIPQLAQMAGFADGYFCQLFKQNFGCSPMEYVNHTRIQHAKFLLLSTSLSVQEVMSRCGFSNLSYFGKIFRRHTGCSPVQFRKHLAAPTKNERKDQT